MDLTGCAFRPRPMMNCLPDNNPTEHIYFNGQRIARYGTNALTVPNDCASFRAWVIVSPGVSHEH